MTNWPVRTVITDLDVFEVPFHIVTHKFNDEIYEGTWSRVNDPMVIFSDHNMDGKTMSYHGGAIGGTAEGVPVQLIFWDGWWNGAGTNARVAVEQQAQRMLNSRYFTQLTQYGIPHSPVWRGSITVTQPGAPASASSSDTMSKALDLIDDLIDDDVFPDPDDGPRIAFIVIYPPWFTVTGGAPPLGAHYYDYDYNFPFDRDNYWGGWVRYRDPVTGPADGTVRTLGHELIEIITDPEADGWHTEVNSGTNELVDAGASPWAGNTAPTNNSTKQTAYTDGVQLQAYWSNAHNRTVIPLNDGYRARLTATLEETSRWVTQHGTFRPAEAGGLTFCIEDRDYWWKVWTVNEQVSVRAESHGFHTARVDRWTVNGQPAPGPNGVLSLPVTVSTYDQRRRVERPATPSVAYRVGTSGIDLAISGAGGGFDLVVGCHVTDADITGNVQSQPEAAPWVQVGVRGVELELEPDYERQLDHCLDVLKKRWQEQENPLGRPRPGDPPYFNPGVLRERMPSYTPHVEWLRAREVARAITAAYALLSTDEARAYATGVLEGLPTVAHAISVEEIERALESPEAPSERHAEPRATE